MLLNLSHFNLKKPWYTSVLKKYVFEMLEELTKNTHTEIQCQVIGCNLANIPADIRPKNCLRKSCFWHPGCHMYIFCIFISRLFSSRINFGVRIFRDLIKFDLQGFLTVALILICFISIRAWVENLHIWNCIENLRVIMPHYFYKGNNENT